MKTTILCLFIFISRLTLAQNTFEQVFLATQSGTVDLEFCHKTIELPNGNYVSIGLNDGCTFCSSYYYLRCVDHAGSLLWQNLYAPGQEGSVPDVSLSPDGNIVFILSESIPQSNFTYDARVYFMKIDYYGNLLINKNYDFNYPPNVYPGLLKLFLMADSSFVFVSSRHMAKLDSNLDSIYGKSYGVSNLPSALSADKKEIIIQQKFQLSGHDTSLLVTYNSNLDSIKCRAFTDSAYRYVSNLYNWGPSFFHEISDKLIVFDATTIPALDSAAFICLDSTLSLKWVHFIESSQEYIVPNDFDFDSVSVTFSGQISDRNTFKGPGFLYKFDLNGDSAFFKTIHAENIYDETGLNIVQYGSSGYILSGYAKADTSAHQSYIAVTDTSGNFITSVEQVSEEDYLNIGGNPSGGEFKVFLPEDNKYIIRIFDSSGKFLFSKTTIGSCNINIVSYPSGMYFLNVLGGKSVKKIIVIKSD